MDNIQYPVIGSSGWGTKINNNFKEISDTIGSINKDSDGDIGTQLTNINSQLNALTQKTDSIKHKSIIVEGNGTNTINVVLDGVELKHDVFVLNGNPIANDAIIVGTRLINNLQDVEITLNKEISSPIQLGILYFV